MRERLKLLIRAERALFRNLAVPGLDVARSLKKEDARPIKGLIGNLLGLWRDFNDGDNLELASRLEDWWQKAQASIEDVRYDYEEQVSLGQHRYKGVKTFTSAKESSPRNVTYHFGVSLEVDIELNDTASAELTEAVRKPISIPYMGQSNCLAQIHIKEG
jgi:hypothetical protein